MLHDGERRAQRRRLVTAVAIVTAVVTTVVAGTLAGGALRGRPGDVAPEIAGVGSPSGAGSSAAAAGACVATPLPAPPGKTRVQAVSVDPTGHYVGGYHVEGQNFVPILLLSGQADPIVPASNSAKLAALLSQAGARVEHKVLPAGHQLSQGDITLARNWIGSAGAKAA